MINLPYISKVGKGRQVEKADSGGREDRYQRTVHGQLFLSGMLLSQGVLLGILPWEPWLEDTRASPSSDARL